MPLVNAGNQQGFNLIEILLSLAVFLIIVGGGTVAILHSFSANRLEQEQTAAKLIAQEGIEAARSIKNQGWSNLTAGTHGISSANGYWEFAGSNNSIGKYTRQLTVTPGQRDGSGNIVDSGGAVDASLFKVTSTVQWNFTPTRNNQAQFATYLTRFDAAIPGGWSVPQLITTLDLAGRGDGRKIQIKGNYAYIVRDRDSTNANFTVVNITNPTAPTVVGSLLLSGSPHDIYVEGNYAYVASDDNSQELQIVNITNPATPTLAGTFNASGNTNMLSVYTVGSKTYLGRAASAQPELYEIDVSTPSTPTLLRSLELGADANDLFVNSSATGAYVASSSNTAKLQTINLVTMSISGTFNAGGNADALSITSFGTNAIIGRVDGQIHVVNVSNPAAPTQIGVFNAQDQVNDLALFNSNNYLFAATNSTTSELQVVNITNTASPVLLGSLNLSSALNGIAYDPIRDRAHGVGGENTGELTVIGPQL